MRKFFGFQILDAKILLTNLVSFFWTLILPLFSALVLRGTLLDSIETESEIQNYLSWFWIFIIVSSFIYGVGLKLARFRDMGILKTYILISGDKRIFIYAILLNQFIICLMCLMIFSFVMAIVYNLNIVMLLLIPFLLLVCSIPFAFATLLIATINLKHSTLNTIASILIYPGFLMALNTRYSEIEWTDLLNPFNILYTFSQYSSSLFLGNLSLVPFLFLLVYLLIGFVSIRKINLVSRVER
ncbi:hypothetical protein [Robertmurraya andreesenii]|uniref:ABC-2 type transport system permease protein n=1 Tax=Anoxybacillus andreesenii TaxID=1325932 RepID=A0ABT9V930_9BACL|nr:hypothetical protein [Robertmurraya andreesenii]MDQ0157456.1 ABC-2 type transport system permease protein [Robertmurraya andreesenii]